MASPAIYGHSLFDHDAFGPKMKIYGYWYVDGLGGFDDVTHVNLNNDETANQLNTMIRDALMTMPLGQGQQAFTSQQVRYKEWTRG